MGIVKVAGLNEWIDLSQFVENPAIRENCSVEKIQKFLDEKVKVRDLTVTKAEINTTGCAKSPRLATMFPAAEYEGLPGFCDIRIAHKTGNLTEEIIVWVPLVWNERFFGINGGGNRTMVWTPEAMSTGTRMIGMSIALKNGFSCACTDGGCRSDKWFGWGVDYVKKELDLEMYFNWIDYSTHVMATVGKAVTGFVCGMAPRYSYTMGNSGGGRQVIYSAQKYPQDYDGYFADCPVLSYQKMLPALSWPAVVMNTYKNVLTPEKFEAFRAAAWEKAGGREAFYETTDIVDVDPFALVGQETASGPITETDALVMQKIWEGARSVKGDFLWYGMRPGVTAWTMGYAAVVKQEDGSYKASAFLDEYFKDWIMKDESWNFDSLTIEGFDEIFRKSCYEFSSMDLDNPDLRNARDLGDKIILCHGVDDEAIYVDGTIDYYEKVMRVIGDKERTKEFARLFIIPGDGHGFYNKFGCGPSSATGMAALMNWVEDGVAPDVIHGQHFDMATQTVDRERDNPAY